MKPDVKRYLQKMTSCTTMTDLLIAMSSWQSYADSHGLTKEERKPVEEAYLKAEEQLISQVKSSLW